MRQASKAISWSAVLLLAVAFTSLRAVAGDLYDYDAEGRLARVTYGTGRIVDYAYDDNGNVTSIVSSTATGVEPGPGTPALVNALRAGEPNPASRESRVRFSLARGGRASLRFFDAGGRLIHSAVERDYPAGEFEARILLRGWPAGVYFYKLEVPGFSATRKLVVVR